MSNEQKKAPYNILQNIAYLIHKLWNWDKPAIWYIFFRIPTILFLPICAVYLPKIIVAKVEQNADSASLIVSVLLIGSAMLLLKVLERFVAGGTELHQDLLENKMQELVISKSMDLDYEQLDRPATQVMMRKAFDIARGGESNGITSMLSLSVVLFANLLGFLTYAAILSQLNILISILILAGVILVYLVHIGVNRWVYRNRDNWLSLDLRMAYLTYKSSSFDVAKDIRLYRMKDWFHGTFYKFMKERIRWTVVTQLYYYLCTVSVFFFSFIRDAGAYIYLIYLFAKGSIALSDFVLYIGIIRGFSDWCMNIMFPMTQLHQQNFNICDMRKYFDLKSSRNTGEGVSLPSADQPCEIILDHVDYQYGTEEKKTIKDISLQVKPGEKIAIVGANGAGKTTLVKMLCGLYTPSSGRILVNGYDIKEYNRNELYRIFAPVFQDVRLLPFTIEQYITLEEADNINLPHLNNCLSLSGFDEVLKKIPNGLKTNLLKDLNKDAVQLSGGEEQKLMLARALYKNAPIMILDEPTAALDPIAENNMYLKYNELTKNKTSFFISHRLASTRFCDRIILMDHGMIAEMGTHEELLAKNGLYTKMFEIQSKYYQEQEGGEPDETNCF